MKKSSSFLNFFTQRFTQRFLAGAVFKVKSQMAAPRIVWLMKKLGIEEKAARGEVLWELGLKLLFILRRAFYQYLTLIFTYIQFGKGLFRFMAFTENEWR